MRRSAVIALFLLASAPARGADVALNVGLLEVATASPFAHAGLYPSLGVSLAFPVGRLTIIPSLAVEASFDQGRCGLVLGGTLDFALSTRLGFDLNVVLIHDQPGLAVKESLFFLGGGPGLSIFLGKWAISPYLGAYAGLNMPGLSLGLGVNVAWTVT